MKISKKATTKNPLCKNTLKMSIFQSLTHCYYYFILNILVQMSLNFNWLWSRSKMSFQTLINSVIHQNSQPGDCYEVKKKKKKKVKLKWSKYRDCKAMSEHFQLASFLVWNVNFKNDSWGELWIWREEENIQINLRHSKTLQMAVKELQEDLADT